MTKPALDAAVLENLRLLNQEGQPDVVREVLTVFLADAPRRLAAIDEAMATRDAASLHRAAHALKGAAGNIGATTLHQRCGQLDETAKAGDLERAPDFARQVHDELARVQAEIAELLAAG